MLILASQSPRRSEILRQAGIPFVVRPAQVDESVGPGEPVDEYVRRIARKKAMAVEAAEGDIILAADTVVVIGGEILGKPQDAADAVRMLERLAGREHEVITGVCFRRGRELVYDRAVTRVWFAPLTRGEIEQYVASGEPKDKAGAYAIQGLAAEFVQRIEGSYTNVVGLPVELVTKYLADLAARP